MSSILLLTSIWIFKTILYTINSREICCICSCFSSSLYKNIQWKLYDYMWHTDSWFSWNISMNFEKNRQYVMVVKVTQRSPIYPIISIQNKQLKFKDGIVIGYKIIGRQHAWPRTSLPPKCNGTISTSDCALTVFYATRDAIIPFFNKYSLQNNN